jgi:lysosomal acid lipase/cholesteryl ester hydrolase
MLSRVVALCLCLTALAKIYPDTNFKDYVQQTLGVTVEDHFITTQDGYINHAFRFPQKNSAPVVLFQHGLLASSWSWTSHENVTNNPPYIAWKMGYDVWLTNTRGNIFSLNHTTIKNITFSKQFWNFTFNEMGLQDVPAHIKYVLAATKRPKLTYVGWSQGTTQFWIGGSDPTVGPLLQSSVNLHIALSPVAWMTHSASELLTIVSRLQLGQVLEDAFPYDFLNGGQGMRDLEEFLCKATGGLLCHLTIDAIMGTSNMDDTVDVENLVAFFPAGAPSKDMNHYEQFIDHPFFRKYDYGAAGNMREYGSNTPPNYALPSYKVPTAFFVGTKDDLANVNDVKTLQSQMPPSSIVYSRTYTDFSHVTWMAGNQEAAVWLDDFKSLLKQYNPL